MLDSDDGDILVAVAPAGTVIGLVVLVIALIVYFAAWRNEVSCESRPCLNGSVTKLIDHECVCVTLPLDTKAVDMGAAP